MRQLILPLAPDNTPTLDNFVPGSNAEPLAALRLWLGPDSRETVLLLWGESGSGRTHLLRAAGGSYHDAADDPGLAGLPEAPALLAVDNVASLDAAGQIVLFNRFNRLRASGGRLLVAADQAPAHLALREDLRTRLGSGLIYRLHRLTDGEQRAALAHHAALRGLRLADEVLDYLLTRAPRDMRSLTALIDALDRHSLEHKRPITLPLLRAVLQTAPTAPS